MLLSRGIEKFLRISIRDYKHSVLRALKSYISQGEEKEKREKSQYYSEIIVKIVLKLYDKNFHGFLVFRGTKRFDELCFKEMYRIRIPIS